MYWETSFYGYNYCYCFSVIDSFHSFLYFSVSVSLSLPVVPPVITTPPVSSTVLVNTSAQFQCCSSGVPLPVVHWVKNGTLVDADERINFAITEAVNHNCSQLIISNPVFPDRGEYTCHASNVLAEELMATSNSVELVVQCKREREREREV